MGNETAGRQTPAASYSFLLEANSSGWGPSICSLASSTFANLPDGHASPIGICFEVFLELLLSGFCTLFLVFFFTVSTVEHCAIRYSQDTG